MTFSENKTPQPSWIKRWLLLLEAEVPENKMARFKLYFKEMKLQEWNCTEGLITAKIEDKNNLYPVQFRATVLPREAKEWVLLEMSKRSKYEACLLSGEIAVETEDLFSKRGLEFIPKDFRSLHPQCGCEEPLPCKHLAAFHLSLAQELAKNPFLLFEFRGITQDELISAFQTQRNERSVTLRSPVSAFPEEVSPQTFWDHRKKVEDWDPLTPFAGKQGTDLQEEYEKVKEIASRKISRT